jgi:hypothetical protein
VVFVVAIALVEAKWASIFFTLTTILIWFFIMCFKFGIWSSYKYHNLFGWVFMWMIGVVDFFDIKLQGKLFAYEIIDSLSVVYM